MYKLHLNGGGNKAGQQLIVEMVMPEYGNHCLMVILRKILRGPEMCES